MLYSAATQRGFSQEGQGCAFPSKRWLGHSDVVKKSRKEKFDALLRSLVAPEMRDLLFDFLADSEEAECQGGKVEQRWGRSQSMPVPSLTVGKPTPIRSTAVPSTYSLTLRIPSMPVAFFAALFAMFLASAALYGVFWKAGLLVMHSDLEGRLEELIMIVRQQNDSCYTDYSLLADDSLLAEQKLEDPGFVPEVQVNPFTEGDEDLRTSPAMSWEESPSMEIAAILHESLLSPSAIQVGAPFVSGFFLVRFLSEWSLDHPCVVITLVTVAFFVLDTFSCELGEEPGSFKSIFAFCRESTRVSSFLLVILQLSRDRLKSRRCDEGHALFN